MADTREIVITIKKEETKLPSPTEKALGDDKKEETPTGVTSAMNILANQVYQRMKASVITEAKYQVNRYFSTRDDYIGQRNAQNALTAISHGMALGASVLAGMKVGLVGGAVGMGVGALVGASIYGVSSAVGIYNTLDQQALNVSQRNATLQFSRERAGWSLTSGSIGEGR